MSRAVLHGVLKMPPSCWSNDALDRRQRYARYYHASEVIEGLDDAVDELTKQREHLQKLLLKYSSMVEGGKQDADVITALGYGSEQDYED